MQRLKNATASTVANYLKKRLIDLNIKDIFGVAGNYAAPFLDTVLADPATPIQILGTSTELNAGYAADAYARYQGYGAAFVTYGVGSFSILNATAGSFVEQVPVLVINGAPTNKENSIEKNAGLLFSHSTGNKFADLDVFQNVTAAAERITDANLAPFQIDKVITAMMATQQPGYIEVAEDVWRAECSEPEGVLSLDPSFTLSVSGVEEAVTAAMKVIQRYPKLVVWAGIELRQQNLSASFHGLLEQANQMLPAGGTAVKFITSLYSKSVIDESNPYFDSCRLIEKDMRAVATPKEKDYCLLGIGAWTVDANVASQNIRDDRTIIAAKGGVLVGAEFFPTVALSEFITELQSQLADSDLELQGTDLSPLPVPTIVSCDTEQINFDTFFYQLQQHWQSEYLLLSGVGFTLSIASYLNGVAKNHYLTDGVWLSIGYPVAAATGVTQARQNQEGAENERTIVVVGDGAFQEVCQAVSDQNFHGQNNVIFVLSNSIYGIEQFLVNPNPFRHSPTEYPVAPDPDSILNSIYAYNDLHPWDYIKLAEAFGSVGRRVENLGQLKEVLAEIEEDTAHNFLVEVVVPQTDIPADLLAATGGVGEDETANEDWPPAGKF